MKSNKSYRWTLLAVLAILLFTLSAGTASARDYAGSFNLPFATQWGSTTLPAGDYTFSIEFTKVPYLARIHGKNVTVLVMANAVSDLASPEQSAVIIRKVQDRYVVRALHLAELSLAVAYGKYETPDPVLSSPSEAALYQRVLVSGK